MITFQLSTNYFKKSRYISISKITLTRCELLDFFILCFSTMQHLHVHTTKNSILSILTMYLIIYKASTNSNFNDAAILSTSIANFALNTLSKNKKKNVKNEKSADKLSAFFITTFTSDIDCDYCYKTNHFIEDYHALKYKKFYELHNPSLYLK